MIELNDDKIDIFQISAKEIHLTKEALPAAFNLSTKKMRPMNQNYQHKSSVGEIRERFDYDVERFSNLDTGQQTTLDAPLCLDLITSAAKAVNPDAKRMLDIGCGAGNYTLKMLSKIPDTDCTLVDLSLPMLEKAKERVCKETSGKVDVIQKDVRDLELPENHYDIIVAGAVLHHLREEEDWVYVFRKLFSFLKRGGSLWISDLVVQDNPEVNQMVWDLYGEYLKGLGGSTFKDKVFAYIEKEDSPRSVNFQLGLMEQAGFSQTEVLHKNLCFAAFGGIK